MSRKPLSKAVRFEVFKRDSFKCQYCGASAPDVILEVDHIKPVSKGGTNDLLNLITSCRDCNRGKHDKPLTDRSFVAIQRQQLEDLQERREQITMMLEWREQLANEIEVEIDAIDKIFDRETDWILSDVGRKNVRKLIRQFGFDEVYEATVIAIDRYYTGDERSWNEAFRKIGGICYNRRKARDGDA